MMAVIRLLFLLFFLLLENAVESNWILEVKLHRYINPTSRRRHRGTERAGDIYCCDDITIRCDYQCDNVFTFCLQPSTGSDCQYGIYETGLVAKKDNLTFTDGEPIGENAVPNPLIFNGTQWPDDNRLHFWTNISDIDYDVINPNITTLQEVDRLHIVLKAHVSSDGYSNITTLIINGTEPTGIYLQVSYNMSCDQGYYGCHCDMFSQPTDDVTCDMQVSSTIGTNATVIPTFIWTGHNESVVRGPINVASKPSGSNTATTTTTIIGSVVALLVTIAVVVSVTIVACFVLLRRKNYSSKKSQDLIIVHNLNNPIYSHKADAAPASAVAYNQPDIGHTARLFDDPVYEKETQLPNSNTNPHYSLASPAPTYDEPQTGYFEGGPPEAFYTQINKKVASPRQ